MRVEVLPSPHETLVPALAEHHAVDQAKVAVAVHHRLVDRRAGLSGRGHHALGGAGMGREPGVQHRRLPIVRRNPAHEVRIAFQLFEETGHRKGIVPGARQVAHAEAVGFDLLFPAEARSDRTGRKTGEIGEKAAELAVPRCGVHDRDGEPAEQAPRHALGAVAGGDMADLVADHAGKLGFVVRQRHQAPCHVDVAAGQGEGVDHVAVEDRDGERFAGHLRDGVNPGGHQGHMGVEFRKLLVDPELVEDGGVVPRSDRLLLLGRHHGEHGFARRRIRRAPRHREEKRGGTGEGDPHLSHR